MYERGVSRGSRNFPSYVPRWVPNIHHLLNHQVGRMPSSALIAERLEAQILLASCSSLSSYYMWEPDISFFFFFFCMESARFIINTFKYKQGVEKRYKEPLGTHQLTTIVASIPSTFLQRQRLEYFKVNPGHPIPHL